VVAVLMLLFVVLLMLRLLVDLDMA